MENCKSWARLEFILHVIQISGKAFQKNFVRIQPGLLHKGLSGPKYRHHYYQSAPPPNRKPLSITYLFPVFSNHTLQNELCLRLPWDFRFWAFRINEVLRPVAFRSVISSELKTHVIASTSLQVFLLSSILFVRYNMFNLFISW